MSVLDDLPDYDINPFDLGTMYENPEGGGQYVVKDDVREALRNPTDDMLDAVAAAEYALRIPEAPRGYWRMTSDYKQQRRAEAKRWLAAAAGGDE